MVEEERPRIGKLPPKYTFILNPYTDYRFTRCPHCDAKMKQRKLPLFIHVDAVNPIVLNKTCRYCPDCDLLLVHQDELEELLAGLFAEIDPTTIGNDYLVLGTVEREVWQANMKQPKSIPEMMEHLHDFKDVQSVRVQPGGWYPADMDPSELPVLEPTPPDTTWRRQSRPPEEKPSRSRKREKPAGEPKHKRRRRRRR